MRKKMKRLSLGAETLRYLDGSRLRRAGGVTANVTVCNPNTACLSCNPNTECLSCGTCHPGCPISEGFYTC